MARPSKFDSEDARKQLKALCRMKPTLEDAAAFFEVSTSTIEKAVKRHWKMSFSEFRNQNMVQARFMVYRELLEQCKKGNTAILIYMSKKLIPEFAESSSQAQPIEMTLNYKLED